MALPAMTVTGALALFLAQQGAFGYASYVVPRADRLELVQGAFGQRVRTSQKLTAFQQEENQMSFAIRKEHAQDFEDIGCFGIAKAIVSQPPMHRPEVAESKYYIRPLKLHLNGQSLEPEIIRTTTSIRTGNFKFILFP